MPVMSRLLWSLAFAGAFGVSGSSTKGLLRGDNFAQVGARGRRQVPEDAGDDGYEYGDKEVHARDADSSDYSVHQFITADDGRDAPKMADDDQAFAMRRAQALAKEDHFNSEDTPSLDNFLQTEVMTSSSKRQLPPDADDGYEYGDNEAHARDADSSDYSVHQFIATDDGRDGPKIGDDQAFALRRAQAMAKEDHFNSEDTPSTDTFLQQHKQPLDSNDDDYEYGDEEVHAPDVDSSDYSAHQFIATDDSRDGPKVNDYDQAFALKKAQALAKEDHFNSEETPSAINFLQKKQLPTDADDGYEYGDQESHARDADSSDYSVHQFITNDDGRDGPKVNDDDQSFSMRRAQALAKADHFNSEETPSNDN